MRTVVEVNRPISGSGLIKRRLIMQQLLIVIILFKENTKYRLELVVKILYHSMTFLNTQHYNRIAEICNMLW